MGMTLITAPTAEPLSVTEVKNHIRDCVDDESEINALISAARQWVEGQTHRALMPQTWDFTFDYQWPCERQYPTNVKRDIIRLPMGPLTSVTSITYVDAAGATQTLSTGVYQVVSDSDHPRIERAYEQSWPSVRDQPQAITVRAVMGYASASAVPYPLKQAMKLLIGHWYENREAVVVGQVPMEVPLAAEALISPYRRASF